MYNVFIGGSGGIGQAAGLILADNKTMDCHIYFGDINEAAGEAAMKFVSEGCGTSDKASFVLMPLDGTTPELDAVMDKCDIILDCLPGSQAPRMAKMAKQFGMHYANLTEYVHETEQIMEIAKDAETGFILQTGLAPGFINVLACRIYEEFSSEFGVDIVDSMIMKVGALSDHAPSPHFYAFTWSPIGVATEYLKDADIVRDFKKVSVPALSGCERIIIDGEEYEDNFTSGGAADLPEAFAGKVKDLDYKTLRYPGHYDWVQKCLNEFPEGADKIQSIEKKMLEEVASVEDDVVIVYAAVQGKDSNGRLRRKERSYKIYPSQVGTKTLRAIQSTTAAPLCEAAMMLLKGNLKGVILQSQLPTLEFLNGDFVASVYGKYD